MNYRHVIGLFLMFGAVGNYAAGDNSEDKSVSSEKSATGVILEYGQDSAEQPEETDSADQGSLPSDEGGSVEFIVGGQAEDGVAKRKQIPVRE